MKTERRASLRLPAATQVVLSHRAQSVIGTLRDIGLGGAFLEVDTDLLPFGGMVELKLSFPPDAEQNYLDLPAIIERTTGNGAAVSFRDVGQDAYFRLVDLVLAVGRLPPLPAEQAHA